MTLFDDASVMVAIADFVGVDAGGKVNAIGLGFTVSGMQPNGFTAPQFVVAFVDAPGKYAGDQTALTLELRNLTDDEVVKAPAPSGQLEALRITNQAMFERPIVPGVALGADMPVRIQMTVGFPAGLPNLAPGKTYAWKLQMDGRSRQSWRAFFHLPSAPPGPIIGGPAGPATIPNVAPIDTDSPEPEA
jgi:hypothetical protein